jgi:ribosome-associated toxin RatA of RatAB toxin-antitoxin module
MTSISNSVTIYAPVQRIYELASATERWPEILPHYRFVRVLEERDGERVVEMAAQRGMIPVRWTALQRNDPELPAVYFRHIRGWTAGMEVAWRFAEDEHATTVSIVHDLTFRFPIAREFVEKRIVCGYFIDGVASRTLACMKALAEDERSA